MKLPDQKTLHVPAACVSAQDNESGRSGWPLLGHAEVAGMRRRLLGGGLSAALSALAGTVLPGSVAMAAGRRCETKVDWPQWQAFREHFIQKDGRVLDASTVWQHSSSEGQSYAMFFALVANDPETFEHLWHWAVNNLAKGNIHENLPAWLWGVNDRGEWGVIDDNSAADGELWFIYDLLEAARLWNRPDYKKDAMALLALVEQKEVAVLPGMGAMLLPGYRDFVRADHVWQLNASYLVLPLLRRLEAASPKGPWGDVARNTVGVYQGAGRHGFAADWVGWQAPPGQPGRFIDDPVKGELGSYDAIRTYMWAGMTPADDPLHDALLQSVKGMAGAVRETGLPPEKIMVSAGTVSQTGPFGFSAALVPYFWARGENDLMRAQQERAEQGWHASLTSDALARSQPPYYDHVLNLFSTGWQAGHYSFGKSGALRVAWEAQC